MGKNWNLIMRLFFGRREAYGFEWHEPKHPFETLQAGYVARLIRLRIDQIEFPQDSFKWGSLLNHLPLSVPNRMTGGRKRRRGKGQVGGEFVARTSGTGWWIGLPEAG